MIINDLDGYYIVFDTKNWNTELDTLVSNQYRRDFIDTAYPICCYATCKYPTSFVLIQSGHAMQLL